MRKRRRMIHTMMTVANMNIVRSSMLQMIIMMVGFGMVWMIRHMVTVWIGVMRFRIVRFVMRRRRIRHMMTIRIGVVRLWMIRFRIVRFGMVGMIRHVMTVWIGVVRHWMIRFRIMRFGMMVRHMMMIWLVMVWFDHWMIRFMVQHNWVWMSMRIVVRRRKFTMD